MFQMINDEMPSAQDRKMVWVKVGAIAAVLAAVGGVLYFFAFAPYLR